MFYTFYSMKAVKLGRGLATITASPGYRFGYLLDWQNQTDAVTHSEFSSETNQSSFGLKSISLRLMLPDDWKTTRFILFLTSEDYDIDENRLNNSEEQENGRPSQAAQDLARPALPVCPHSSLETVPGGDEAEKMMTFQNQSTK